MIQDKVNLPPGKDAKSKLNWAHRQLISVCKQGGVPQHVAFVMDGNRRFARAKKLASVVTGHEKGFESLLYALEICLALGVKIVTVYAFSEENFSRAKEEVDGLMNIAVEKFKEFLDVEQVVMREGVVVDMWGRPEILPEDVRSAAARVVLGTKDNKGGSILNVCFAYSGTEEVAHAMRRVAKGLLGGKLRVEDVSVGLISRCTYARHLPPPDLLIRTSGETRLSDFLLWHMRDTKLAFIDVLWPDLDIWHFLSCVVDWQVHSKRDRPRLERVSEENFPGDTERIRQFLGLVEQERLDAWAAALKS
jgi:ditrans,polycis-polyprenyl diphosphate synthase